MKTPPAIRLMSPIHPNAGQMTQRTSPDRNGARLVANLQVTAGCGFTSAARALLCRKAKALPVVSVLRSDVVVWEIAREAYYTLDIQRDHYDYGQNTWRLCQTAIV